MSITIYDGLLARDSSPFAAARALRGVLEPEFLRRFKELADHCRDEILATPEVTWEELVGRRGPKAKELAVETRSLEHSLHGIISELHESSDYTFSPAAISYNVALLENKAEGNPLVLVFGEHARAYRELLLQAGVVSAYGYWDNSDPDEDVSEAEWDERARAWTVIGDSAPSEVGLEFFYPSYLQTAIALMKLPK